MFGKLLSEAVKIVTLPVDIAETTLDVLSGGDGTRRGLDQADIPRLSKLRDAVCETIEEIDK